jgi:hypothetical protein
MQAANGVAASTGSRTDDCGDVKALDGAGLDLAAEDRAGTRRRGSRQDWLMIFQ